MARQSFGGSLIATQPASYLGAEGPLLASEARLRILPDRSSCNAELSAAGIHRGSSVVPCSFARRSRSQVLVNYTGAQPELRMWGALPASSSVRGSHRKQKAPSAVLRPGLVARSFFGREVSVFSDPLQTLRQLKDQGNVRCSHCSKKRRGRDMVLGNDTLMSFRHHCTLPTPFQHVVILVSAACRQLPLRYCPSPVALQPAPDMGSSESGRRDK